jgi:hypothetical protein
MYDVVTSSKAKGDWLQIRIDPDLKEDVRITAEARGLSVSALVHSMLKQAVRDERNEYPHLFEKKAAKNKLAPVVATLGGREREPTKADVQRMITTDQEREIEHRLKPRKTQKVPVLKQKAR